MNHIQGCAHGCKYPCYAYLMAKRFGKVLSYDDWKEPRLVSNTLEILDKEIPRLKNKIKSVQLCFTTDPFMCGYDEIKEMSLAAIRKLNDAEIKCCILTKGILPIELAEFSRKNEYGITLISLDENYRQEMEPGSAPYQVRLAALRALHDRGYYTWVSVEPYPTPNLIEQDIHNILDAISFVDKIIFGRTNYSKEITAYTRHKEFYNKQAAIVVAFCKERKIAYYIKRRTIT
ncbi:MAG: radical SAM protein [Megasphaera sp.]|nr:radical SAM protein [Megasphaera sp.]